ncbi:MAG: hypothetical protein HQK83_10825 [Fibrobacteria bacterium]|nr:hypothetical protein [Fibrobacteria bacterium]
MTKQFFYILFLCFHCINVAIGKDVITQGIVVDSATLLPISGASVTLFQDRSLYTTTDEDGLFIITPEITQNRSDVFISNPEIYQADQGIAVSGFAPNTLVKLRIFNLNGHCIAIQTGKTSVTGNITFSRLFAVPGMFIVKVNDYRPQIINISSSRSLLSVPLLRSLKKSQNENMMLFIKKNGYREKLVPIPDSIGSVDTISLTSIVQPKSSLLQNVKLQSNGMLIAANNSVSLVMQPDGNLVLYRTTDKNILWDTKTSGHAGAFVILQKDGNLVIYDGNKAIWSSGLHSGTGFTLAVQNDGNLVMSNSGGAVWSTGTQAPSCNLSSTLTGPSPRARIIEDAVFETEDVIIADYDVTDFGADKTGLLDATDAMQSAIDACFSSGGGTVWVPAGEYNISSTIFVKPFVTLRGDWRNPDSGTGKYGTVIRAVMPSGEHSYSLFMIGGSAGVKGMTIFYPNQNIVNPVKYNYTFYIPGNEAPDSYMMASILNCTMLNSYKGIGITIWGGMHECSTVRNVKGTVLFRGVEAYDGADVGTWQDIKLSNTYWANAGEAYNAPPLTSLNKWTLANGEAFVIGDLEWDQFYRISCSHYRVGIRTVTGRRIAFAGEIAYADITNTEYAVINDVLDSRWGMSFFRSTLKGSAAAIQNNSGGYVKTTDCILSGGTSGTVHTTFPETNSASIPANKSKHKPARLGLLNVTSSPFLAPYTSASEFIVPTVDATGAIQAALDSAAKAGGGVVYLPAGWYRVEGNLNIGAYTELRGCSSVPQRDQAGMSRGTVLFAYAGKNTAIPDDDLAFITLRGNSAGVNGLRIFYPENNPLNGLAPFPFTFRGIGNDIYLINIGLANAYNAVHFQDSCNNHYIRKIVGCVFNKGIVVGAGRGGWIEGVLTNGAAVRRVGYQIPGWITSSSVITHVINVTRNQEELIVVSGAENEQIFNCFAYGAKVGLHVVSGKATVYNLGTDNVKNYGIQNDNGSAIIYNFMRYGGSNKGTIELHNEMIIP